MKTKLTLLILLFIAQIYEIFFLPTLPFVGATLSASKNTVQLSVPLVLLATAASYFFSGIFADRYGPKNTLLGLTVTYSLGLLTASVADNITLFLIGMFLQGLGASYGITIQYIHLLFTKNALKKLASMSSHIVPIAPLFILLCGLIDHNLNWRYVFITMLLINIALITLLYTSRSVTNEQQKTKSPKQLHKDLLFFLKHLKFNHYVFTSALISSSQYVFYTLAPYIYIVDFHLSSKTFALLLMLPSAGTFIGWKITSYASHFLKHNQIIFLGIIIACISCFFIIFFSLIGNLSPLGLMLLFTFFQISISLTTGPSRIGVTQIKQALAGFSISLFSIIINSINWFFSHIASQQHSEILGIIMFTLSVSALSLHFIFNHIRIKKSQ